MLIISMALPANRYRNASIRLICDQGFLLSIVLGITSSVQVFLSSPSVFLLRTKNYCNGCAKKSWLLGFFCNLLKLLKRGRVFDVLARSLLEIRDCVKQLNDGVL